MILSLWCCGKSNCIRSTFYWPKLQYVTKTHKCRICDTLVFNHNHNLTIQESINKCNVYSSLKIHLVYNFIIHSFKWVLNVCITIGHYIFLSLYLVSWCKLKFFLILFVGSPCIFGVLTCENMEKVDLWYIRLYLNQC